jgi:hypothetical protein
MLAWKSRPPSKPTTKHPILPNIDMTNIASRPAAPAACTGSASAKTRMTDAHAKIGELEEGKFDDFLVGFISGDSGAAELSSTSVSSASIERTSYENERTPLATSHAPQAKVDRRLVRCTETIMRYLHTARSDVAKNSQRQIKETRQ